MPHTLLAHVADRDGSGVGTRIVLEGSQVRPPLRGNDEGAGMFGDHADRLERPPVHRREAEELDGERVVGHGPEGVAVRGRVLHHGQTDRAQPSRDVLGDHLDPDLLLEPPHEAAHGGVRAPAGPPRDHMADFASRVRIARRLVRGRHPGNEDGQRNKREDDEGGAEGQARARLRWAPRESYVLRRRYHLFPRDAMREMAG